MKRTLLLLLVCVLAASAAWATTTVPSNGPVCVPPPTLSNVPISDMPTLIANAHGNTSANRNASAQLLGWINQPASKNLCGGYFADPYIPGTSPVLPPVKTTPVTINAGGGSLVYSGESTLTGGVTITQPGRIVTSDQASLMTNNGNYQTADLNGNVMLREQGKVAVGQSAHLDLQGQAYTLENVIYRLFLGDVKSVPAPPVTPNTSLANNPAALSAWGKASSVVQPPSGITQLHNVSYSTCPPESRAWDLEADQIDLNQDTGRGTAHDAVLYAGDVPVLYAPYFNFPIDNRRQSGFLYPQVNFGSDSGFGLGIPYYWNIAPNLDDTITPYYYTKRGFAINNLFRYLTATSHGSLNFTVLPNDGEFRNFQETEPYLVPPTTPGINDLIDANPTRSFVSFTDDSQFDQNWGGSVNYTRVSDDYFAQDIGSVPQVAQNQLLQQGQVTYTAQDWNFLGNLQSYQTLHPVNEAVVQNQYSMLPQLLFTSHLPITINTLNFQWQAEAVNFNEVLNPGQTTSPPDGQRLNLIPAVSLPLSNSLGYITPEVQYELTQYNLGDQPEGFPDEITRGIPITDIDSGLFFQRDTDFLGTSYLETLEPRIFYLYVPFKNQNDIPVFDSSLQPFSYNQLFYTNRFTGSDRIGDANQMSFALSTRFLDKDTGNQKFFAGVGIIKYFQDRQVTCNSPTCSESPFTVGYTSPTEPTSPIVAQAQYNFNPAWNASANAAWDPNSAQTQNANFNFQYMPLVNHIFNVGYNFVRFGDLYSLPSDFNAQTTNPDSISSKNNLSEPTASFVWPVTDRWSVLGDWGYSWNRNESLTYFAGVQYDSCCWAIQTVYAKSFTGFNTFGTPQYDTGVYVQWAFKGLAKVAANDPTTLLLHNISGYQNNFGVV